MDKVYKKIENYLKGHFPNKALIKYKKITDKNAEVYGFNTIQILVVERPKEIFYQVIFNK